MAYNTVKVKKYVDIVEEYVANAAITPGHLVELMSTGKVRVHATAGGNNIPMFALEDELQGKGIDDDYAALDPVQVWVASRGEIVYALLKNGENVVIGDFLESGAGGTLQKHVSDEPSFANLDSQIIGQALEAVDMSGSSAEDPTGRILVRIA